MTSPNCYDNLPMVLTVQEVSQALRIGRNATYQLVHSGQLYALHIGRTIRIPKDSLRDYLSRNT